MSESFRGLSSRNGSDLSCCLLIPHSPACSACKEPILARNEGEQSCMSAWPQRPTASIIGSEAQLCLRRRHARLMSQRLMLPPCGTSTTSPRSKPRRVLATGGVLPTQKAICLFVAGPLLFAPVVASPLHRHISPSFAWNPALGPFSTLAGIRLADGEYRNCGEDACCSRQPAKEEVAQTSLPLSGLQCLWGWCRFSREYYPSMPLARCWCLWDNVEPGELHVCVAAISLHEPTVILRQRLTSRTTPRRPSMETRICGLTERREAASRAPSHNRGLHHHAASSKSPAVQQSCLKPTANGDSGRRAWYLTYIVQLDGALPCRSKVTEKRRKLASQRLAAAGAPSRATTATPVLRRHESDVSEELTH
jgi:hypothetical protein